jgi:hypothetical protein
MNAVTHFFSAAEEFARLGAKVAALRLAPTAGLEEVRGRGRCLEPHLSSGSDLIYLQRGAQPVEGDLFAFTCTPEEAKAYSERTGIPCGTSIMKFYLQPRPPLWDEPQFLCNESFAPLGDRPIIGVIRAIRAVADAGQLQPGAATAIAVATYPGTVVSTGNTGKFNAANGAVATTGPNVDCTAIVTIVVSAFQSAGTAGQIKLTCAYTDDGGGTYSYGSSEVPLTGTLTPYTLQWQFAHLGSNSALVPHADLAFDNTGPSTNAVTYGPVTSQIEMIIR